MNQNLLVRGHCVNQKEANEEAATAKAKDLGLPGCEESLESWLHSCA